ncbi:MAG: T9SS type A sorting domain-containing protein [Crocinitomicaceae bacterium]
MSTEHTGYNENDQVISKQTFNKNEDVWFLLNSYNYEYDEDGDISHYLFDSPSKKMRSVYTKDGKGKLTSVVREEYKNGVWQMYSKEEQHYHHAHGLDFTIQKVWFSMTNEWTNNSKSSYLKDATGLIEQNIGYEWLEDEEHWNKISRRTYTYAVEQDESVQEPIAVSIYPNPTSNLITVDNIPEGLVTIITSFGKPVYRKKNKENQLKINVASFPNGYYFIRVNDKSIGNFVKAD